MTSYTKLYGWETYFWSLLRHIIYYNLHAIRKYQTYKLHRSDDKQLNLYIRPLGYKYK